MLNLLLKRGKYEEEKGDCVSLSQEGVLFILSLFSTRELLNRVRSEFEEPSRFIEMLVWKLGLRLLLREGREEEE